LPMPLSGENKGPRKKTPRMGGGKKIETKGNHKKANREKRWT